MPVGHGEDFFSLDCAQASCGMCYGAGHVRMLRMQEGFPCGTSAYLISIVKHFELFRNKM